MSVAELRRRSTKLEKQIWRRNAREYAAGAVVAVLIGFSFFRTHDPLARVAFAMLIGGLAAVTYHLHRHGSARSVPSEMGIRNCLEFLRGELERQRDLVGSVWTWYLGPLIPGQVVLTISSALANRRPTHLTALAIANLVVAGVLFFIARLNARAARALQSQIDKLNADPD
jgi:hypothetical protein